GQRSGSLSRRWPGVVVTAEESSGSSREPPDGRRLESREGPMPAMLRYTLVGAPGFALGAAVSPGGTWGATVRPGRSGGPGDGFRRRPRDRRAPSGRQPGDARRPPRGSERPVGQRRGATKGASIILAKVAAGCTIPWHWHAPNEHLIDGERRRPAGDQGRGAVHAAGGRFCEAAGRPRSSIRL